MNSVLDTPANCGRRYLLETKNIDCAWNSSQTNTPSLSLAPSRWTPTHTWCSAEVMTSQVKSKASLSAGSWRTRWCFSWEATKDTTNKWAGRTEWHPKGDYDSVNLEFTQALRRPMQDTNQQFFHLIKTRVSRYNWQISCRHHGRCESLMTNETDKQIT